MSGATSRIAHPAKNKTFYNGFQPLVTVQENSPAFLKKSSMRKKDKEGYQSMGLTNRAPYDSFMLQA
tara:strand:+ start:599 stop:799 length:201 start_codon:yes stop_codon:yes gene_type:complete